MTELPEEPEPVFTPHCCVMLVKMILATAGCVGLGWFMVSEKEWGAAFVLLLFGLLWFAGMVWLIAVRYRHVREYRNAIASAEDQEPDDFERY